jgi:hypothetical protein
MKRILLFTVLLLSFVIAITSFAAAKKPIICNNTYALCNAAQCHKIPGVKNKVLCKCSVWKGKNIGYSTCKMRYMRKTKAGGKRLLSTFAFGGGHYKYMTCQGGNFWASCLDKPCFIDKSSPDGRTAHCTCKLMYTRKAYVTFAGACDQKYCGEAIWSGASVQGNQLLAGMLAKSLGKDKLLDEAMCRK